LIFEVAVSRVAAKRLDTLDRETERRIRKRFLQIAVDPFDERFSKPLTHPKGHRSSRIGGWRIVFSVNIQKNLVDVLAIGSRGQVYRGL
jgi:mRNA interferase RelE/StbE